MLKDCFLEKEIFGPILEMQERTGIKRWLSLCSRSQFVRNHKLISGFLIWIFYNRLMKRKIKGLLLDLDGTLIDSNDAHAKAWQQALAENGIQVDYEDIRSRIGMGGDKLLPDVTNIDKESELGQKIDKRRTEIFHSQYLPQLKAFPGSQQLLKKLREKGLQLIVASSASEKDLKALLKQGKLEDLVDQKTSSSEAENSKPDPDIIEAALDKSGLDPESVMMLGDTPYDVQAAKKAGVRTIAFTCGGWGQEDLKEAEYIFTGPDEMLATLEKEPASIELG